MEWTELGREHPEWRSRLERIRGCVVPWIRDAIPLEGRTVLEYGCGQGVLAVALAPWTGRYVGVDILREEVEMGRAHVANRGLANVELHAVPAGEVLAFVESLRGEIDVLLLYAVLEHMSIAERLDVLRLAREVVKEDGHIVVGEVPNRLTPIDHHTGQMPFLHSLPLDLVEQYYSRSTRADFLAAIDAAAEHGSDAVREALIRWGRGMSFHELDLVFDDLERHTVASSYAASLYPARPVRGEELALAALLEAWRPDLPPCWSRSWLDMILSVTPRGTRPEHVRPWQLRLDHGVDGAAVLADGRIELVDGARVPVRLPAPTRELHVGLVADDPAHELRVHVGGRELAPPAYPNLDGIPQWHAVATFATLTHAVELELVHGGCLTYVGYRGPPDPEAPQRRPMGW